MFKDMEVVKLMSHLIITLAIILGYVALIFVKGTSDATLQGCIFAIIGYWFGAVGLNNTNKKNDPPSGGSQ